jgi:reactive intermediate/imine deaminase
MGIARQTIHSDQAPKAIGPYSQAMRVGDMVFMAGQIPLDPVTMQMVEGDFEKEATRVFENIKAVITEAGGTFAQVVMVRIFLTHFDHFAKVNEVMQRYFKEPFPPRTTVAVAALPKNARVEVECTLHLG